MHLSLGYHSTTGATVVPEIVAKLTPSIEDTIRNSINGPEPPSGNAQREYAFDLVS